MTNIADRMQYYSLKKRLKEEHEKKLHNLELNYANIIVQLMREKERVHKEMQNAFYNQLEQINKMMFESLFRNAVKQHYSQSSIINRNTNNANDKRNISTNKNSNTNTNNNDTQSRPILIGHTLALSNATTPESILPARLLPTIPEIKSASVPTTATINSPSSQLLIENPPEVAPDIKQEPVSPTTNTQSNALNTLIMAANHVDTKKNNNTSDSDGSYSSDSVHSSNLKSPNNKPVNIKQVDDYIEVENGFACRICMKVLARAYDIKRHVQCVHGDERPYKCEECGQTFKLQFHLKEHRVIHLSVRPFVCHFCDRRFSRKRDIAKHCKRRHKEEYEELLLKKKEKDVN